MPTAEAEGVPESPNLISAPLQPSHRQRCGVSERLPPCIVGRVRSTASYEQLELEHCPGELNSDLDLEKLSDSLSGPTVQNESSVQVHHRRGVIRGGRVSDTTLLSVVRPQGSGCASSSDS